MQIPRTVEKFLPVLYWTLPVVLWLFQLAFTLNTLSYIRHEEIMESVRNVYWLDQGTIFDGINSNVGLYATFLFSYKIFGFSLTTGRFVKLGLHLVSLVALAFLIARLMGRRRGWLILLLLGLSPTWLYFNSIQAGYGTDLTYLPLCFLTIALNDFRSRGSPLLSFALGLLAMAAAMTYPAFLVYLPVLFFLYMYVLWLRRTNVNSRTMTLHFACGALGFLLPFAAALLYLKDPGLLLYDSHFKRGIFRGAGVMLFDLESFARNVVRVLGDVFVVSGSYYFELKNVELGALMQIPALVVLGWGLVLLVKRKEWRPLLLAAYGCILLGLVIPNLTDNRVPGIRRATGVIVGFYAVHATLWYFALSPEIGGRWKKRLAILVCVLPLLHHLAVYLPNRAGVADSPYYKNKTWFALQNKSPDESLQSMLDYSANGGELICPSSEIGVGVPCKYAEIFGAMAGYRAWNGLEARVIRGYDWKTGKTIPLHIGLWESHYFFH